MPTGLGDEKLWISATNDNTGTSTAFDDQSGEGNDGTATGATVIADANDGGTYAYNMSATSTSRIALPASFDSTVFSDSTVCGWFKYSGPIFNADPSMALIGSASTSSQWYTAARGNHNGDQTGRYRTYADDGSNNGDALVAGTGNEEDNAWHHVAFVRDYTSNTGTIYVDGVSIGSAAFTSNELTATQDLFIGYSSLYGYSGDLSASGESLYFDDIRAYNRVLTQAEITHLASSRGVEGGPPVGLGDEQLWLCPSINDSANDISGNGNNGTLAGGTAIVSDSGSGGTRSFESYTTSTDRVDIPAGVFTDGNDVSFSLWVKNKQTSAGTKIRNIFRLTNDDLKVYAYSSSYKALGGAASVVGPALNTTEYWHFAVNYTEGTGTIEMFKNGVSVGSAVGTGTLALTGTIDLLQNSVAFVDDIRSYNRVLTGAEITHLASARGVEGPPPVGLGDEKLWFSAGLNSSGGDLSGNGNNAVISAGVTTASPPAGSTDVAWFASGSGNSLNMDDAGLELRNASLATGKFSMSFWVLPESTNNRRTFGSKQGSSGTRLRVGRSTGGTVYSQFVDSGNYIANGSNGTTTTDMTHFVMVWEDNAFAKSYVNGVLQSEDLTVGGYAFGSDLAAFEYGLDGTAAGGYIDDIRGYDRILTPAEITHLASSRGVEGPAPVGLGDEQLWLCPSLSDNANDISGNGNNGTYQGGMGTIVDTSNGGSLAYDFDGTDDRIDCPSTVLGGSQVFSMACWVYVNSHDATYGEGFMGQFNTSTNNTGLVYAGRATSFRGLVNAGGTNYTSSATGSSPPTGAWHHLVSVVDGSNITLYVDGVSQGSTAYSGAITSTPSGPFEIGRYDGSGAVSNRHCLDGKMDDVRAYHRAITSAEITHLASSRGVEGGPSTPTTQYNAFATHAFKQLFQTRLR